MSDAERTAAIARHPCARLVLPASGVRGRIAPHLDMAGPHRDIAAAVLHARGRAGVDLDDFAAGLGLPVQVVQRAECGHLDAADLPEALADAADLQRR